ncbi:MAG: hypothetical protein EBT92_05995 [Planctomycetes bacterium]|nr:hypothetical protein [Planctomycetota bacterium]NBY01705.1 hypothetical protein [Planctomycetota bacterium]
MAKASLHQPPIDAEALSKAKAWQLLDLDAPSIHSKKSVQVFDPKEAEGSDVKKQWLAAQTLASSLQKEAKVRWEKLNGNQPAFGISFINLIAQRILVPTHWLKSLVLKLDYDLLELKRIFKTSAYEVIALRLLDLENPCIITIVDNGHIFKRKSNCCNPPKILSPTEAMVLDYVHENSRTKRINDQGWQVTGWPVHQLDWRREILRSIPPEFPD